MLDGIAGAEFRVWLHPATERVTTKRLDPPGPEVPPPVRPGASYFNGARLRRVDPSSGDG